MKCCHRGLGLRYPEDLVRDIDSKGGRQSDKTFTSYKLAQYRQIYPEQATKPGYPRKNQKHGIVPEAPQWLRCK